MDGRFATPATRSASGSGSWTKTVASFSKTRLRGQARAQLAGHLVAAAAYNLLRIAKLMSA